MMGLLQTQSLIKTQNHKIELRIISFFPLHKMNPSPLPSPLIVPPSASEHNTMGKLQQPSSPSAITLESAVCAAANRRAMRGLSSSCMMFRSSSMPRLLPSPLMALNRENSVVFGNDSCANIKINYSLLSLEDDEQAVVALLEEITQAIQEQTNRKQNVEKQMSVNFKLAKARYMSGSRMGAILSMRKAHKSKATKAYIAGARFRLIALRKDLQAAMQQGIFDIDVAEQRNIMKTILAELTVATTAMPSDEDLLGQLRRSIMVESAKASSSSS